MPKKRKRKKVKRRPGCRRMVYVMLEGNVVVAGECRDLAAISDLIGESQPNVTLLKITDGKVALASSLRH